MISSSTTVFFKLHNGKQNVEAEIHPELPKLEPLAVLTGDEIEKQLSGQRIHWVSVDCDNNNPKAIQNVVDLLKKLKISCQSSDINGDIPYDKLVEIVDSITVDHHIRVAPHVDLNEDYYEIDEYAIPTISKEKADEFLRSMATAQNRSKLHIYLCNLSSIDFEVVKNFRVLDINYATLTTFNEFLWTIYRSADCGTIEKVGMRFDEGVNPFYASSNPTERLPPFKEVDPEYIPRAEKHSRGYQVELPHKMAVIIDEHPRSKQWIYFVDKKKEYYHNYPFYKATH